jgi:hypothetical protein
MARDRISIRIELDHRTDADAREFAKAVERSKRNAMAVLLKAVLREWKLNPDRVRELGWVR